MIRHIVLTKVKKDCTDAAIAEVFDALAVLSEKLPGADGFAGGPSQSPENLERGYTHGFVIDFSTWDDLKTYADHPDHRALGQSLVALTKDGVKGLLVVDLAI